MSEYKAIKLKDVEVGTVSSMKDGSVKFSIYTAELRPSESAALLPLHGKACSILIEPQTGSEMEMVEVTTGRDVKSSSQRLYACMFLVWKSNPELQGVPFAVYREQSMEKLITHVKTKIKD